jgi:squalene synthase HpnD
MAFDGTTIAALVPVLPWAAMGLFRGRFWRADQRLEDAARDLDKWPEVVCVIPARDEAATIGLTVTSLLGQDYRGALSIIVVDDNSRDGTAAAVPTDARVTVVAGKPLPAGWTGKLWAVDQGLQKAASVAPGAEYVMLTDADIEHDPESLRRLVAKAGEGLDLVSLMVLLKVGNFWERLLIPAFVFFFQKLYPFAWVNDPGKKTAAAAGGCMLVRRRALDGIGGVAAIKGQVIDDCALAAAIKDSGGSIWLGLTTKVRSIRAYEGLSDIWSMVTRTAFVQLRHSALMLACAVLAMSILYLAPPGFVFLGLVNGSAPQLALGFLAWALMAEAYRPTLTLYRLSSWRAWGLPLAALLYCAMTVDSARRHWRGGGGAWKGRSYRQNAMGDSGDVDAGAASGVTIAAMNDSPEFQAAEIVRRAKTSFYWAMRRLPAARRNAMFAIYAFCREVDDIADEPGEEAEKNRRLDEWRGEIERLYAGDPQAVISRALASPVARFGLGREDFLRVIDGMKIDARDTLRIADMSELEDYCDRVACAVGRLSNRVFGVDAETGDRVAAALGEALQLTNILRDLAEDAARDRLYLPLSLLRAHGIDEEDPAKVLAHSNLPKVCVDIADRARRRFDEAAALLGRCDRAQMRPAVMMMEVYRRIFERLVARGWSSIDKRVSLSKAEKLWVVFRYGII